jgi:hypothetical protein
LSSEIFRKLILEVSQAGKQIRFVLIGGPGQGKTTISQFLCQLYRVTILRGRQVSTLSAEVQHALTLIGDQCQTDEIQLPSCRRFPVRVILNHFARELAHDTGTKSLLSYIKDKIKSRTDIDIEIDDMRLWLRSYPWLLILDGLDEVPSSSNRDEVLAAIQDFWIEASEGNADILVMATTRPQGYDDDFSPKFYAHRYLTPLPTERALLYGRRLAHARYGNDPEREGRIISRLQRAATETSTSRLMRSPLQVTIMATLVDQTGQPPHERWRLFHEYYEVIYRRESERDIPTAELLRDHKSNIDEIHHQVGLLLQIESEKSGLTDAHLTASGFSNIVRWRLSDEGYTGGPLDRLHDSIIEAAAQRLVFLVGVEAGQIGFEIRSLQEFMAAESLMNGSDALVSERLNSIASISHWRNVFLFCAGRCFAVERHRRDTILSICATLNESEENELLRQSLSGSQLALDVLADGAAHRQPKFDRSLAWIALRLMDRPNRQSQLLLADIYEPSMETIYREEIDKRLNSAAVGICANSWIVLFGLADRDVAWAAASADSKWPPELDIQGAIFRLDERGIRFFRSEWCGRKLLTYLPYSQMDSLWSVRFNSSSSAYGQEVQRVLEAVHASGPWLEATFQLSDAPSNTVHSIGVNGIESDDRVNKVFALGVWHHPDWKMLNAVSTFRSRPSRSSLAEGLRLLADVWVGERSKQLIYRVSWPMGACISIAETKEHLLDMADAASSGKLGDTNEWRCAEERWLRGITIDDFRSFEEHDCRIGGYMAQRGFPLTCAEVLRPAATSSESVSESLYAAMEHLTTKRGMERVANWICHLMTIDGVNGRRWRWFKAHQFKTLVVGREAGHFGLESAMVLPSDCHGESDWIEALDYIGRNSRVWVSGEFSLATVYRSAWNGIRADSSLSGLLVILALCSPYCEMLPFGQNDVAPGKQDDPKIRAAAIVLSFVNHCRGDVEARQLGAELASTVSGDFSQILRSAIQIVLKGKVDAQRGTAFLADLCNQIASNWEMYTIVAGGIDDLLRRRRSTLDEFGTQARLRLSTVAGMG